jgi:hypothetical protein
MNTFLLDGSLFDKIKLNKQKNGYIMGGKKITDAQLYKIVRSEIKQIENKYTKLANRLTSGDISFIQWQQNMIDLTRRSHVKMTRLGRGGKNNTFAIHYLTTGNDLRILHYPSLRQFSQAIADGKLTEKQIVARAKLYGSASKNSFETARLSLFENKPQVLARRRLGTCKAHCPDCLRYASEGWLPISSIIPPGEKCACKMNCCCSVEIKT